MKNFFKNVSAGSLITSILFILCGLVMIIFPSTIQAIIAYALAGAMVIVGIIYIIQYIRKDVIKDFYRKDLTVGIICMTLGIIGFIKSYAIFDFIPVMFGILVLYSGVVKLQNAFDMMRIHKDAWLAVLIMALVNIVFGIFMIVNPGFVGELLFRLLGVGLAFGGITDVASMILFHSSRSAKDDQIVD